MSADEVCRFIEADSLGYLSMEGMLEACGFPADTSCVACWTGAYPTRINADAETQWAREREPVPSD
jgi:amidophosphoribosyltransferase